MNIIKIHIKCCIKKIFFIGFLFTLFSGCTSVVRFNNGKTEKIDNISTSNTFKGLASYYSDKFDGKKTASGELFSQKELTAAHKTLPFGTIVKVTRISNQKQVVVRINDRGPFVEGRVIDLSYRAALELDLINAGVAEVIIEIIK